MWVEISAVAALCQVSRNLVAKQISSAVSPAMNSWARFAFNLPFSAVMILILSSWQGLPHSSARVLFWCLSAALLQIVANVLLINAYNYSTFCEASVFTRLEAVFGALLGVLFFDENPTALAWIGLWLSFVGVALLNVTRTSGSQKGLGSSALKFFVFNRGSIFAMLTGFCWALGCYFIKDACQEMCVTNPDMRHCSLTSALYVLLHITWIEVLLLTAYLTVFNAGEFKQVGTHWKAMLKLGFLSFAASVLWFWAYNITMVAYARAFGNVESLLSVALSHRVLKEQGALRQIPGIIAIIAGVALVVAGGN